jgi:hypothetical protein
VLALLQIASVATECNPITPLRNVEIETSFGVMILEDPLFFFFLKLPTKIEFCKNLPVDGHLTLLNGVNKCITVISTFIDRFW